MTSRLPRRPWYLVAANGQKDVLLWDLKPSAEHSFEVGLTTALSKASHLSSAGHLYAQHHVSTRQAGEGELRHLGEQQDQCREKRQQRGPVPITPAQQGWPSLSPACPHHPGAARLAFPEPCCVHCLHPVSWPQHSSKARCKSNNRTILETQSNTTPSPKLSQSTLLETASPVSKLLVHLVCNLVM